MDQKQAEGFVKFWAKEVGADVSKFDRKPNGWFRGLLGATDVEFFPEEQVLMLRWCVLALAGDSSTSFLEEIRKEMEKDGESLIKITLELDDYYSKKLKEPALFFCYKLWDGSLSHANFAKLVQRYRKIATIDWQMRMEDILNRLYP